MTTAPKDLELELGATGLKHFGGYVREELHKKLQGSLAAKVYREMSENNPLIFAALSVIEMMLRQVTLRVDQAEKGGDTPAGQQARDFVEECFADVEGGTKGVVADALSAMTYGWAWQEKVFKKRTGDTPAFSIVSGDHIIPGPTSKYSDGRIGWWKFAPRSQDSLHRWHLADNGTTLGMWQMAAPAYRQVCIPRSKSLHYRIRPSKDNPEGRSMLRGAYTSYFYKSQMQMIEAIGVERNMAGVPDMQVPMELLHPNATTAQRTMRAMFEDMVQKLRADHHAGIVRPSETDRDGKPTGFKLSLMSTSGKNPSDADPIIKRYASWILISLQAEFLLLGMDKVGSFALSSDKTSLFAVAMATILESILDEINENAIPEILKLNGMPTDVAPKLVRGDIEKPNLPELAAYVGTMAGVGAIVIDDDLEKHVREVASLPPPATRSSSIQVPDAVTPAPELGAAPQEVEEESAAAELAPEEGATIQQVSLNGAQVASLIELVQSVARGELQRESALGIMTTAFPVDRAKAEEILADAGRGFTPATQPSPGAPG